MRQTLNQVSENADSIAQENGSQYFQKISENNIHQVNQNTQDRRNTETRLGMFKNFYNNLSVILPDLLAATLFFAGKMDIGQLFQVGTLFMQVNSALSFFVMAYESIADYKIKIQCIQQLNDASLKEGLPTNAQDIKYKKNPSNTIRLENISITTPKKSDFHYILKNMNVTFNAGENILIKGSSGIGKSTLFKAINHAWSYGEGIIYTQWKSKCWT